MKLFKSEREFYELPCNFSLSREKALKEGNCVTLKTNPLRGTPKISFDISVEEDNNYEYIIVEWAYNEFIVINKKEIKRFATKSNDTKALNIVLSKIQKHPVTYEIKIYAFNDALKFGYGNIYINNFKNVRTVNNELIPSVSNMSANISTFTHNMKTGKTINPVDNEELFVEQSIVTSYL